MPRIYNIHHGNYPSTAINIMRPSKWSNPFRIGVDGDRDTVCNKYEAWFEKQTHLIECLSELEGQDLLCCCHPKRCHGDYLIKRANGISTKRLMPKGSLF